MSIKGSMSAEEQRKRFGLTYGGEKAYKGDKYGRLQDDKGNIWYKDGSGETKYLGKVPQFSRGSIGKGGSERRGSDRDGAGLFGGKEINGHHTSSNKLIQRAHDKRQGGAGNHSNGFNSINDLAGSLRYLLAKESAVPSSAAPSSAAPTKPYEDIPGVDSYVPRERYKPSDSSSDSLSDSIYNYGKDYNFGDFSNRYGNEQGLRDREGSIEDAGSLLNDWVFKIKNELRAAPKNKVDNIGQNTDNENDVNSNSRYHTSNYY